VFGGSNWGLVGRWVAGIPGRVFINTNLSNTPPVRHEVALGWAFHYLTGAVYGVLYIAACQYMHTQPDLINAVLFGVITVLAPYFILKPGMGAGGLARKTPSPLKTCLSSLLIHICFGIGLWIGVQIYQQIN
jgi:hypothetical protein